MEIIAAIFIIGSIFRYLLRQNNEEISSATPIPHQTFPDQFDINARSTGNDDWITDPAFVSMPDNLFHSSHNDSISRHDDWSNHGPCTCSGSDWITDPCCSFMSGNIFHNDDSMLSSSDNFAFNDDWHSCSSSCSSFDDHWSCSNYGISDS